MKSYKLIIPILILAFALAPAVSAQSTTSEDVSTEASAKIRLQGQRQEVRGKVEAFKARASSTEERTADRTCGALAARIDARLSHFGTIYDKHVASYEFRKETLLRIAVKLKAEGIATAKLEANIALLDGKIDAFKENQAKVKAALENARRQSCNDDPRAFSESIEALRQAQRTVAENARDIYRFLNVTIRQDIIDLRAAYKAQLEI